MARWPRSRNCSIHDPYGAGWLFRLQTDAAADLSPLMSAGAYANFLADESK